MKQNSRALNKTRKKAVQILYRVDAEGAYVSSLLQATAQDSDYSPGENSFVQAAVKGTLENLPTIDEVLDSKINRGLGSVTPWIKSILRLATYQVLHMNNVRPELAVNEAVELAKEYGHEGSAKLVNAILRGILRDKDIPKPILEKHETETAPAPRPAGHPDWLIQKWTARFGAENTAKLCDFNNSPQPLFFRTNSLKTTTPELVKILAEDGVESKPAHYAAETLLITKLSRSKKLHELRAFTEGLFHVQDESSILVGQVLDPQPHETIIDLCSAPGGKATHAAIRMGNKGRIIAVDLFERKLFRVQENATRLGITIIECVTTDARAFAFAGGADRVIVDAPCSGLGALGRKKDARWNKKGGDIQELVALQTDLLNQAATLVKPGGVLVYSTCTIEAEENEDVIAAFLKSHPNFVPSPITTIPTELLNKSGQMQTLPYLHQMGGAFAARFQRVK